MAALLVCFVSPLIAACVSSFFVPTSGTTVHCKDAIFVMTSNLAQREIAADAEILRNYASEQGAAIVLKKRNASRMFMMNL